MKIAVFHELTPLSGARKVVEEYGNILSKENTVDLFYVDQNQDKNIQGLFTNIYFFKFNQKKWEGNNWKAKIYKDTIELFKLFFLHKHIAAVIKKGNYDFVFVNPSKFTQAPFLLRFLDNTVYFSQETLRIIYDNELNSTKELSFLKRYYEGFNRKLRKLIDKNNILKAKIVLANSKYSKINIKNAYGIDSHVCYLGVDVEKFIPLNIKKQSDLLFIGEKMQIEGYDLLEKTLALYSNKPSVKFIERARNGKGISQSNLIKEINMAKIVLALSKNEPFGLINIEAMSCGIPVIAINEGGFRESILNDKTGYLIERSETELKKKIDLVLENESLRKTLGKFGRLHVVNNFTWEKSVGNFLKIIDKNL